MQKCAVAKVPFFSIRWPLLSCIIPALFATLFGMPSLHLLTFFIFFIYIYMVFIQSAHTCTTVGFCELFTTQSAATHIVPWPVSFVHCLDKDHSLQVQGHPSLGWEQVCTCVWEVCVRIKSLHACTTPEALPLNCVLRDLRFPKCTPLYFLVAAVSSWAGGGGGPPGVLTHTITCRNRYPPPTHSLHAHLVKYSCFAVCRRGECLVSAS